MADDPANNPENVPERTPVSPMALPVADAARLLGCLSLFGDNPDRHRMLAEHVTAEYPVKTEGRGRTVDEWKLRPDQPDNHWLDCLVGSAVAASIQGAVLFGTDHAARPPRPKLKLSELQRQKRRRDGR